MRLRVIAYSQSEYWYTSTNKGYIMTCKDYNIAKDDDNRSVISHEKKKILKIKEKEVEQNFMLEKTKFIFGGRRPCLRKNKIYFGEGIKRSQRRDGIFGTILKTALPLIGKIVKGFK